MSCPASSSVPLLSSSAAPPVHGPQRAPPSSSMQPSEPRQRPSHHRQPQQQCSDQAPAAPLHLEPSVVPTRMSPQHCLRRVRRLLANCVFPSSHGGTRMDVRVRLTGPFQLKCKTWSQGLPLCFAVNVWAATARHHGDDVPFLIEFQRRRGDAWTFMVLYRHVQRGLLPCSDNGRYDLLNPAGRKANSSDLGCSNSSVDKPDKLLSTNDDAAAATVSASTFSDDAAAATVSVSTFSDDVEPSRQIQPLMLLDNVCKITQCDVDETSRCLMDMARAGHFELVCAALALLTDLVVAPDTGHHVHAALRDQLSSMAAANCDSPHADIRRAARILRSNLINLNLDTCAQQTHVGLDGCSGTSAAHSTCAEDRVETAQSQEPVMEQSSCVCLVVE